MGAWLAAQNWQPHGVWISSARRCQDTWHGLQAGGFGTDLVALSSSDLYVADAPQIGHLLKSCPAERLLLIGHNPGLTDFGECRLPIAPA